MPGIMQQAGQFPSPVAHEYPISDDAKRYYRSGKSLLFRTLPFWIASVVDRLLFLLCRWPCCSFPRCGSFPRSIAGGCARASIATTVR